MIEQIHLAALVLLYLPLCAGIITACICRLDLLNARQHRIGWHLKYVLMSFFAGGEFLDAVLGMDMISAPELVGLLAVALHLALTQQHWLNGPPEIARKQGVRP
jgi:hypothetical protein